jgi:hypothetical protein
MIAKAAHDLDQLSPHENSCFVLVNPAKISSKKILQKQFSVLTQRT